MFVLTCLQFGAWACTHMWVFTLQWVCDVPRFLEDTKHQNVCKIGRIHKVENVCVHKRLEYYRHISWYVCTCCQVCLNRGFRQQSWRSPHISSKSLESLSSKGSRSHCSLLHWEGDRKIKARRGGGMRWRGGVECSLSSESSILSQCSNWMICLC